MTEYKRKVPVASENYGHQSKEDYMINEANAIGNAPTLSTEQVILALENGADAWREPTPLQRPVPPSTAFPSKALGHILGALAEKMHSIIQAPLSICGQTLLASAGLAVQGHADLVIDGRVSPVSVFFVTIAETGARKSQADSVALLPHRQYQEDLNQQYVIELEEYKVNKAVYDKAKEEAICKKYPGILSKKEALRQLGDPPKPPLEPFVLVDEPTYEGLVKLLAVGHPSLGLFTDEGGRFIGGHGMNTENQLKTAAGLSGMWDGKPINRIRSGDDNCLLYGKRLSTHIMLQPSVAPLLFSNSLLLGQGLPSRCLVVWPESMAGRRKYKEIDIYNSVEMKNFSDKIRTILSKDLPRVDSRNELQPRPISLSSRAKTRYISFHDFVEKRLRSGRRLDAVKGLANKAPEHAARLAAVLALFEDVHCVEVSELHMRAGIKLMLFYLSEAHRLFDAGVGDQKLMEAQVLLDWLQQRGKSIISLVEIYRFGPNSIRNAKKAKELMSILFDHGWVRKYSGHVEFEERLRGDAWEIRQPVLGPAIPANAANDGDSDSQDSRNSQRSAAWCDDSELLFAE